MKWIFTISFWLCLFISLSTAYSQISWQHIDGPYGGRIRTIKQSTANEIVAFGSNAYRTSDQGLTWYLIKNDSFSPLEYFFNNGTVFGISMANATNKNYVYRSIDNMTTWTKKNTGLENQSIRNIKFEGTDIYACTDSGVYKSSDNGDSWSRAYYVPSLQYNMMYDLVFLSNGNILLATVAGCYRSTDNGTSWQLMNPSSEKMKSNVENIIVDNEERIYLNTPMAMFRSDDKGDTWIQIGDGVIDGNLGFILSPVKGKLIAGKSWGGIFVSSDFGDTWKKACDLAPNKMIITEDGKFIGASKNGILVADSLAGEWKLRNQGISETSISALFINKSSNSHKDEIIAGDETGVIYKSTDKGLTWKTVFQSQGSSITFIISGKSNWIFASSVWGGVARSSDYGDSWEVANQGLWDPDISSLAIDKDGNIYAGSFSDLFKSTDNGSSWSVCLTQTQSLQCESIIINSKNTIFAGTLTYGLLKSTNGGATWAQLTNGIAYPISYMGINKKDELFVTTITGDLYYSSNDGISWKLIKAGLGLISMFFIDNNDILAGVDQNHQLVGIQRSTNNGATWKAEENGAESVYANAFDAYSNGEIFVGTSSGLFHTNESVVSVEDETISQDDYHIFPNPCRDMVRINLPKERNSCLARIINELGICVWENQVNSNGSNSIELDVSNLPAGSYFCIMNSGQKTETLRFVHIR